MEWSGNTALHTAAARGRVELCKLLLACGATVTTRNGRGETPLLTAAIEGQEELVDFLADLQYSSRNAKADALELLGAICWVEDRDADRCLSLWQRAMEERHRPGKPTVCKQHAQKIAVYGHATEVQTPAELRSLQQQSRDDQRALGVQCALISERVLDKGHHTTARAINYVAADLDDDNDTKRTVELLLHSVDNHSGLCPFDSGVAAVYILLVCVLEDDQTAAVENEEAEGDERHRSTFGQILAALKRATSDFRRGEARREQEREKTTGDRALVPNTYYLMVRENLLKVVLHLCCLLGGAEHRATPAQRAEFSALIGDFVRKDAPRGKSGNTLLHMACDEETHVFDFEDIEVLNPGVCDGCPFPAAEAVRVLLDAGADVTAQNEAGHTALKTMHQQKDQRSYENLRIYALMKAARWALHMSKKETPAVSSTS